MVEKFPSEVQNFAGLFVLLQKARHRADYDPDAFFYKNYVRILTTMASIHIREFNRVPVKDRRAFAVYVLLDIRGD